MRWSPPAPTAGWSRLLIGVVVATLGACGGTATAPSSPALTTPTPAPPALAPLPMPANIQTIDGITCDPSLQVVFHVHAHLAVFVGGTARDIPKNIGIDATCTYRLHSHDDDGIVHVEAPTAQAFTLGEYFDIWGIPLDSTHVGPAGGTVITYLDDQRFSGDVRSIPLDAHTLIQLDVNGNVAPVPYSFPAGD